MARQPSIFELMEMETTNMPSITKIFILSLIIFSWAQSVNAEEDHHMQNGVITMSPDEQNAAGITTFTVERRSLWKTIAAPGEVVINKYQTHDVTPRISAQIVLRKVKLGDKVKKGQLLVLLSSVEMAEAQGNLIQTDREWKRVEKLGRQIVSEKRITEAQIARQRAYASVQAFGMSKQQINELLAGGDASLATGQFGLTSPQDGVIIEDQFFEGEVVQPGRLLFRVSDESKGWVEAQLNPQKSEHIAEGDKVQIRIDKAHTLKGRVSQLHHSIDKTTRTRSVRIEVDNARDLLHPGEYVQVILTDKTARSVLAVPSEAISLMSTGPVVFKIDGNKLSPQLIETGDSQNGWTEVKTGLNSGDVIVHQGTFFLKSLMLKSQIGDAH